MFRLGKYGMKTIIGAGVLALCITLSGNNVYAATEVSTDTEITSSDTTGIKVTADCILTFSGSSDITVGDAENECPGIEIADGVTLTLVNNMTNDATLNIYGGKVENDNEYINYAGIYVPATATLNMQGDGSTNVEGNSQAYIDNEDVYSSGAGIGGNGIYTKTAQANTSQINAGVINILSGSIISKGGYCSGGTVYGTGAGIGGGGIYNTELDNVSGGSLQAIEILEGEVYAQGGQGQATGAGIGGGGVYSTITATITKGDIMAKHIEDYTKVSATKGTPQDEDAYVGGNIGAGGIYNNDEGQHGYECLIDEDTTISNDVPSGLYIKENANVTFEGELTIGASDNMSEGINIAPGKTLTMTITSNRANAIKVKGGTYTNDAGDVYEYAGIYVPNNAKLCINQETPGSFALQVLGNGRGKAIGNNWVESGI